mmetsp:Transcript_55754/g.134466  ORF Transcript_55754/g.134466 Transcript_55754/m.134466 type:complete len:383 (+) Transcript_55754:987-2135(+)
MAKGCSAVSHCSGRPTSCSACSTTVDPAVGRSRPPLPSSATGCPPVPSPARGSRAPSWPPSEPPAARRRSATHKSSGPRDAPLGSSRSSARLAVQDSESCAGACEGACGLDAEQKTTTWKTKASETSAAEEPTGVSTSARSFSPAWPAGLATPCVETIPPAGRGGALMAGGWKGGSGGAGRPHDLRPRTTNTTEGTTAQDMRTAVRRGSPPAEEAADGHEPRASSSPPTGHCKEGPIDSSESAARALVAVRATSPCDVDAVRLPISSITDKGLFKLTEKPVVSESPSSKEMSAIAASSGTSTGPPPSPAESAEVQTPRTVSSSPAWSSGAGLPATAAPPAEGKEKYSKESNRSLLRAAANLALLSSSLLPSAASPGVLGASP